MNACRSLAPDRASLAKDVALARVQEEIAHPARYGTAGAVNHTTGPLVWFLDGQIDRAEEVRAGLVTANNAEGASSLFEGPRDLLPSPVPPNLGDPVAFQLSKEARQLPDEALGSGSGLQVQQPAALKVRHGPPIVAPVHKLPKNAVGVGSGRYLHGSGSSVSVDDVEVVHTGLLGVVVLLDLQAQRRRDGCRSYLLFISQSGMRPLAYRRFLTSPRDPGSQPSVAAPARSRVSH